MYLRAKHIERWLIKFKMKQNMWLCLQVNQQQQQPPNTAAAAAGTTTAATAATDAGKPGRGNRAKDPRTSAKPADADAKLAEAADAIIAGHTYKPRTRATKEGSWTTVNAPPKTPADTKDVKKPVKPPKAGGNTNKAGGSSLDKNKKPSTGVNQSAGKNQNEIWASYHYTRKKDPLLKLARDWIENSLMAKSLQSDPARQISESP